MLNQLGDKKLLININGYADFLSSNSYNKLLSKYYRYTYDYYSLSDDDLTVIETILSLSY